MPIRRRTNEGTIHAFSQIVKITSKFLCVTIVNYLDYLDYMGYK